jgi:hypothetical protein
MEVNVQLNMSKEEFFQILLQSVLADIQMQLGEEKTQEDLEGISYIKTFANRKKAEITITKLKANEHYAYQTVTNRNKIVAEYQINTIENDKCEVQYKETITSSGFMQSMNDLLVGVALGYFKKKRFIKMLRAIEAQ